MNSLSIPICLIMAIFGTALWGHAQDAVPLNDCSERLKQAQIAYQDGQLEQVYPLIKQCLAQQAFNKEDRVEAYYLLTRVWLIEGDERVDESFEALLNLDHEYPVGDDPIELQDLYERFQTDPIGYVGIALGTTWARPQLMAIRSTTYTPAEYPQHQYTYPPNILGGALSYSFALRRRFLRLQVGISYTVYQYKLGMNLHPLGQANPNGPSVGAPTGPRVDFPRVSFREVQGSAQLPILLHYDFDRKKPFNHQKREAYPFAFAGFRVDLVDFAEIRDLRRGNTISLSPEASTVGITGMRRRWHIAPVVGLGGKYKIDQLYLFAFVQYSAWITDVTRNRFANSDLLYRFGYIDSDFRLHHLSLRVGIERPLYHHKPRS